MKKLAFNMIVLLLFIGCGNDDLPEKNVVQRESAETPFNDWDTPPEVLNYPSMDYTVNHEGNAQIGLRIAKDGTVDSVWVQQSSTFEELDSLAIATAWRMTFAPAIKDDAPVSSQFVLPFQFRKSVPHAEDSGSSND